MTKFEDKGQDQSSWLAPQSSQIMRAACALASFPDEALRALHDRGTRADILVRGAFVALAPAVGAITLFSSAAVVYSIAPAIFLVPLFAALLDWLITATAFADAQGPGQRSARWPLWVTRLGLLLMNLMLASYAALAGQEANLMQSMRAAELRALEAGTVVGSGPYLQVHDELASTTKVHQESVSRLQRERPAAEKQLNRALMLREKECFGVGGTDSITGVRVVGGRCGGLAAGYKAEADAARRELNSLDALASQNARLQVTIRDLQAKQLTLRNEHLTQPGSVGALIRALKYADYATLTPIGLGILFVAFIESLCLLNAHRRPHQNAINAVSDGLQCDDRRQELLHAARLVEINRDLPPVIFTVTEGAQPMPTNARDEPRSRFVQPRFAQADVQP